MVKNIINWTAGGFFRSIGRVLSFIVIGLLIGLLLNSTGFKMPSFYKILGIDYVNASTIQPTNKWLYQYCTDLGMSNCTWSSLGNLGSDYWTHSNIGGYFRQGVLRSTYNYQNGTPYFINLRISSTPNFHRNSLEQVLVLGVPSNSSTASSEYFSQLIVLNPTNVNNTNITEIPIYFTPNINLSEVRVYVIITKDMGYNDYTYFNFRSDSTFTSDTSSQDAINNQTNILINNNNQNTTDIINNNNQNTDRLLESNQVCTNYDKTSITTDGFLQSNGVISVTDWSKQNLGITPYINVRNGTITTLISTVNDYQYYCYYNFNKVILNCINENTLVVNQVLTIPNDAYFARFTINKNTNAPQVRVCQNGNQAINDTINDSDSSDDANDMSDFINDFDLEGSSNITDMILIPITFLESVFLENSESDYCITWRSKTICLPNGKILWSKSSATTFITFFNLFVGGLLCYGMIKVVVSTIDNALNPNDGVAVEMESLTGTNGPLGYKAKHTGYKPRHGGSK